MFGFSETERRRSARFRRRSFSSDHLRLLHDGKEIYEALTQASDPDAVKVCVAAIALFTVTFSYLHYNVFDRGCEAISGNFAVSARNCLTFTFKCIVMQMRKGNCEKGYFDAAVKDARGASFLDIKREHVSCCTEGLVTLE